MISHVGDSMNVYLLWSTIHDQLWREAAALPGASVRLVWLHTPEQAGDCWPHPRHRAEPTRTPTPSAKPKVSELVSARRAAKDHPLLYTLLAFATLSAVWKGPCAVLAATPGTQLNFARQVDIGSGRELFLECRGVAPTGYPTVVLISGYHDSSDPWTRQDVLSLLPHAVGPAVLPGLARDNRVCAYDRPGTVRYVTGLPLTDRSTPVAQPRTVGDLVSELHGLLSTAQVPGPYVLVGHSLGGLIALLYARTYSTDVRGIVFIDALSPTLPTQLGALWPLYLRVLNPPLQDERFPSLRQPQSERVDIDASIDQVRRALPLRPMPLVVLTKTEPFGIEPGSLPPGITLADIDKAFASAQRYFVELVPTTPQTFATGSEHYIQLSQPDLVINATRLVISRAATSISGEK
jgi:pimeloyl-ACP methyl ester carboxylesterase